MESMLQQQQTGASQADYHRTVSSNSPLDSQSDHAQLLQAGSQELDISGGDVSQTDSNSQGYARSQSVPNREVVTVSSQSRKLKQLSLDSYQRSLHEKEYQRSNSYPQNVPLPLSSKSDAKLDRMSGFYERDLSYYEDELTQEEKDIVIDNTCVLQTIVRHMKDWEHTARVGYGIKDAAFDQLRYNNRNEKFQECAYQAYQQWTQTVGYCARKPLLAWTMLEALHRAEEFEAVWYLFQRLKGSKVN